MAEHALSLMIAQVAEPPATQPSAGAEPLAADPAPAAGGGKADPPAVDLQTQITNLFGRTLSETTYTGWAILLGAIIGGLVAGKILQTILQQIAKKAKARGWQARGQVLEYCAGPANLAVFAAFLGVGLTQIVMEKPVAEFSLKFIALLYVVSLAWFLYNLVDIVEFGIRKVTTDATIIQLIRKALRIFLLIVFGLFVAENVFGADITAWIAGLGLAGLAVSLAAQGPIKNIFGSITVVLDRPFGMGDRIKYGDAVGEVIAMGFRSTKLRTLEGHLVTIPNQKLIDDVVENITARPFIRRVLNVTVTYDTPPEKVEEGMQIIKDLLAESFMSETFDLVNFPPRVYFNNFNADSLNILVMYWYQLNVEGRDWWTYNEQAGKFNVKLLRAFNDAGISFAFPTQTLYLVGDPDRELSIRLLPDGGAVRAN